MVLNTQSRPNGLAVYHQREHQAAAAHPASRLTNPISRASKAPNQPCRRIVKCNVGSKRHLRQFAEHAPTEPAPFRGHDGRTATFAPFDRESIAARLRPLHTPR